MVTTSPRLRAYVTGLVLLTVVLLAMIVFWRPGMAFFVDELWKNLVAPAASAPLWGLPLLLAGAAAGSLLQVTSADRTIFFTEMFVATALFLYGGVVAAAFSVVLTLLLIPADWLRDHAWHPWALAFNVASTLVTAICALSAAGSVAGTDAVPLADGTPTWQGIGYAATFGVTFLLLNNVTVGAALAYEGRPWVATMVDDIARDTITWMGSIALAWLAARLAYAAGALGMLAALLLIGLLQGLLYLLVQVRESMRQHEVLLQASVALTQASDSGSIFAELLKAVQSLMAVAHLLYTVVVADHLVVVGSYELPWREGDELPLSEGFAEVLQVARPLDPVTDEATAPLGPTRRLMPLIAEGEVIGVLGIGVNRQTRPFGRRERALASILANQVAAATWNARRVRSLGVIARTDELTGLLNRHALQTLVPQRLSEARLKGSPFSLLFIDIDHFKGVNDRFGHDVGDAVLRRLGLEVREALRQEDVAVRYGGDEFLCLLPDSDSAAAEGVAARIRQHLEREIEMPDGSRMSFSASIGIAVAPADGVDLESLVAAADQRMYALKSSCSLEPFT